MRFPVILTLQTLIMKRFLFLLLVLFCSHVFGQTKSAGKPYFKLSPGLVLVKDADPTPCVMGGLGGHISRFAALGISGGYLKFDGAKEAIIPLGIDVTFTDFKVKKIQP